LNRLLAIVARDATDFSGVLRGARSPSVANASLRWSLAICGQQHSGGDGSAWSLWRGDDHAGYDFLIGAPPGVVLIGNGQTTTTTTSTSTATTTSQLCRRGRWVFSYDGDVEDHDYLRANTSEDRSVAHDGNSDAQRLLGFLLTKVDGLGLGETPDDDDAIDEIISNAAAEISRRIGSLSFLLSDGRLLYAYRFDRALSIARPTPTHDNVVLIASEPIIPSETWRAIDDRTLLRAHQKLLGDSDDSNSSVAQSTPDPLSERELPFTD
jgi:hypothetical protein